MTGPVPDPALGLDADVLVAGGGPVGLSAALLAARAGLRVVVVEPRTGPVDKACGEGLMPAAVRGLGALGVHPAGRAFHGIRYISGSRRVESRFSAGAGLGVRRTVLHAELAAAAAAAGVVTHTGRVGELRQTTGWVEAAGLRAGWLLAADGLHSPVRRTLGLDRSGRGAPRYGQRQHYRLAPWTDLVEVHWSSRAEAYVTPVAEDEVGVAVLGPAGLRHADALNDLPELRARLAAAEPVSTLRGAGPLQQVSRARRVGRVLLVGDAAGYIDALTGEGVATGLATAEAAVAAIVAGRPESYEREWRRVTRRYRLMTNGLLLAARSGILRPVVVPAAQRLPGVFGAAVNGLAGAAAPLRSMSPEKGVRRSTPT